MLRGIPARSSAQVHDDAGVAGAQVTIGDECSTTTGPQGQFGLLSVERGEYILHAFGHVVMKRKMDSITQIKVGQGRPTYEHPTYEPLPSIPVHYRHYRPYRPYRPLPSIPVHSRPLPSIPVYCPVFAL